MAEQQTPTISGRIRVQDGLGLSTEQYREAIKFLPEDFYRACSLKVEGRCRVCKLAGTDFELLVWINRTLDQGTMRQEDMVAELKRRGFSTTTKTLSQHKTKHFNQARDQYMGVAARESLTIKAIKECGEDVSFGAGMMRVVLMKLQPLIDGLNPDDPFDASSKQLTFVDKVTLIRQCCEAFSKIQKADADTELHRLDRGIKLLRLQDGKKEVRSKILSDLRSRLQAYPSIWELVQHIASDEGNSRPLPALPGGLPDLDDLDDLDDEGDEDHGEGDTGPAEDTAGGKDA